jgi:hypothetical protein
VGAVGVVVGGGGQVGQKDMVVQEVVGGQVRRGRWVVGNWQAMTMMWQCSGQRDLQGTFFGT